MIWHLILWAVLVVESMAFNAEVAALLEQSNLLGCGTCAICSTCYSNCGPGNIGFDQDNDLTSLCTEPTDSTQFWGCLCTQVPVSVLESEASASLANCPSNYPNSTLSSTLAEFDNICFALGFPQPTFSSVSDLTTSTVATGSTSTLSTDSSSTSSTST